MKKLFVAVAMIMSLGISVTMAANSMNTNTEIVVLTDEYTKIELKDVPQIVQEAVAKKYAGNSIKEVYIKVHKDGTKVYKLVLENAEQKESIVHFNEKGEEVK